MICSWSCYLPGTVTSWSCTAARLTMSTGGNWKNQLPNVQTKNECLADDQTQQLYSVKLEADCVAWTGGGISFLSSPGLKALPILFEFEWFLKFVYRVWLGEVNFLHSSPYAAVFCILWLKQHWWHSNALATAEQGLHSIEALPFSCSAPLESRLGVGKKFWEGKQPGQQTQTGQGDIPYHIVSCSAINLGLQNKNVGGVCLPGPTIAWGLAGHQSAHGRWLVISLASLFFFHSLIKLSFNPTHEFSDFS